MHRDPQGAEAWQQTHQIIQDGLWPSPIGPRSLAEGLCLSDVATIEHSVRGGYGPAAAM